MLNSALLLLVGASNGFLLLLIGWCLVTNCLFHPNAACCFFFYRFTLLLDRQFFCKNVLFSDFAHFVPLAGVSCCRDQFGAPQLLPSLFREFYWFLDKVFSWGLFFFADVTNCFPLLSLVSHSVFRTCTCVWHRLLPPSTWHFS